MKKILFILALLTFKENYSQVFRNVVVIRHDDSRVDAGIKKNKTFSAVYANNISAIIIRDFMKKFENAKDVRWFVDDRKVKACFTNDKEYITVLYKTNGYLISTRKNFDGSRLNPGVAAFLNQELGTDFNVNLVTEITRGSDTVFEINLQNEKQICIVQLCKNKGDEELRIIDKRMMTKD